MSTKKMLLAMMAMAAFAFAVLPAVASAEITTTPSLNGAAGVGFTSTSGPGTLITASGAVVKCTSDTNEGKFTTSMTGTVVVTFHGCNYEGLACTTPGQSKGTIQTTELTFHLVYLEPKEGGEPHERPGILFTPHEGHFATFTCAGGLVHIEVRGNGVAGTVTSPKIGGKANKAIISLKATAAGQEHTTVTTSKGVYTKYGLEASTNGGAFEPAYENAGEDTVTLNGGVEATTET